MNNYFEDIEISNFRGFDRLCINGLSKLNVLVGANNVGKTSILESVFMLAGMSNPLMPTRVNYWRMLSANGIDSSRYLFHNIDFNNKPLLAAKVDGRRRRLLISPVMATDSRETMSGSSMVGSRISQLDFAFDDDYVGEYTFHTTLYVGADGNLQQTIDNKYQEKLNCLFISSDKNDTNATDNFATLVKRNKKEIVNETLRNFDSSIESVEALPDGLYLKIHSVRELLPISMAGDGVRRMINIISSVANEDYDIVLIDELDNGLHYSAHKLMWKSMLKFIETRNIQLFVTTHNFDCLQGLKNAMEEDAESHRLVNVFNIAKTKMQGFQAYKYAFDELKTAIDNEIEIRR